MAKGFIHTVNKGGQWINEVEDGERDRLASMPRKRRPSAPAGARAAAGLRPSTSSTTRTATVGERESYGRRPGQPSRLTRHDDVCALDRSTRKVLGGQVSSNSPSIVIQVTSRRATRGRRRRRRVRRT